MDGSGKRLTEFSHGAGCGCKLSPSILRQVLDGVVPPTHPDLLVDATTGDDAAVWRLDDERALVLTTDFFTPVVDDARTWGRIAAANAVSDVYAMGGRPLLALNLVAWNTSELSIELLRDVLAGAAEIAAEAGFVIAGGHSIDDPEPKYGLAVVGEVPADRVLTNAGLRPGDALVLTKPLGVGVITTGIKRDLADATSSAAAVASMTKLNAKAAAVATAAGAEGATDVTGFGLLGHVGRMAAESGVTITIDAGAVPLLPGARALVEQGCVPGGTLRNLDHVTPFVERGEVDDALVTLLADAQTSGGLAFGVTADRADGVVGELRAAGHDAARIGQVEAPSPGAPAGRLRLR